MSESVILKVENLKKTVGQSQIFKKNQKKTLWHIPQLILNQWGLHALVGKNGCGKSTFLRCLLGLIKPTSGSYQWFGQTKALATGVVGYVPEFPIIPAGCSVQQWLCWLLGWPFLYIKKIHDEFIQSHPLLSLEQLWPVPVNDLSKGQQQRVQLWLALIRKPQALILDEPFSGLDPWAKQDLSHLLAGLVKQNLFIVMSTHELTSILRGVCTATLTVDGGTVRKEDGCHVPE